VTDPPDPPAAAPRTDADISAPAVEGARGGHAGPALDRRRRDLERLAGERWDVVVVGGGIVGSGILLDALSRGLRVALIEQDDIAFGTSSRSSRLIHGGLRYLEQYHFRLVREALTERARLLELAPHLVRLVPLVFPLYGPPAAARFWYGSGFVLYDLLGSARRGGGHTHLARGTMEELAPVIKRDGLRGGIKYHDGLEDDARFALAVARTALEFPTAGSDAVAAIRVRAESVIEEGGRAAGIRARDLVSGAELDIRGRHVIDSTGVWVAHPGPFATSGAMRLVPSRGSHIVLPRSRIPVRFGMTLRVPGRVVFMVPWPDYWVIGTTDLPDDGSPDRTAATPAEVDWIIDTVNGALDVDLTRADLVGTYAGLRPLVGDTVEGGTVKVSREHRVEQDALGVTHVSGGKYTTYRIMAADAVDAALGEEARRRPSATAGLPIVGAAPRRELRGLASRLAAEHGLDDRLASRLVWRHGTQAASVVALGLEHDLLRPLGATPHLEAEVLWAVRHELALSLDDVLSRRMRLSTELADRGASIAPRVARILGPEVGWDEERQAAEVAAYLETARREYGVPGVDAPDEPAPPDGPAGPAGDAG
jgi:glycerol-3-phosphate dehydrogenase